MPMKEYFLFSKALGLRFTFQIVECHNQDTHGKEEVLPFCKDAVGVFYSPW